MPTLRRAVAALVAAVCLAVPLATAGPAGAGDNLWLRRHVLNFAHQGGEIEAPSNTLFAFKTAVDKGSDVLELDVHATSDRELVVLHDATVERTTNGEGRVDQMTLEQIKKLDAAYWFVPGCGTCADKPNDAYAYRGLATGSRAMPGRLARFEPNDFKIPTLREVLKTFPDMLLNIEIKATAPETIPYEQELADLLHEFHRDSDTIVVSFLDHAVEAFKTYAPDVDTATGTGEAGAFWATTQGPLPGAPSPRHQACRSRSRSTASPSLRPSSSTTPMPAGWRYTSGRSTTGRRWNGSSTSASTGSCPIGPPSWRRSSARSTPSTAADATSSRGSSKTRSGGERYVRTRKKALLLRSPS